MLLVKRDLVLATLLLVAASASAQAQDLRLEISVPKTTIGKAEPVNLTIKVVNTSSKAYYIPGDITPGKMGMGQFGCYHLEVRRAAGSAEFTRPSEFAADRFPRAKPTPAEFLESQRMVLLAGGMFVGRNITYDWYGMTLLEPGRYSVRIIYDPCGESWVPQGLRFPIYLSRLVSNIVTFEIQPN